MVRLSVDDPLLNVLSSSLVALFGHFMRAQLLSFYCSESLNFGLWCFFWRR